MVLKLWGKNEKAEKKKGSQEGHIHIQIVNGKKMLKSYGSHCYFQLWRNNWCWTCLPAVNNQKLDKNIWDYFQTLHNRTVWSLKMAALAFCLEAFSWPAFRAGIPQGTSWVRVTEAGVTGSSGSWNLWRREPEEAGGRSQRKSSRDSQGPRFGCWTLIWAQGEPTSAGWGKWWQEL